MSDVYFNNTKGDWFVANHNENATINRNSPSVAGFVQNLSMNRQSMCVQVQYRYHTCGACGEKMPETQLIEHHAKEHSEVPFIMDMYELFEIDERLKCLACDTEIIENSFDKHMALCHPHTMLDSDNHISYDANETGNTSEYQTNDTVLYSCMLCNASGVNKTNLRRHHSRAHPDVPSQTNIYEIAKIGVKIICDICGKQLNGDKIEKHRMKYHPDKYGKPNETADGFHNICISSRELERLRNDNRIYEHNERLYLKDSE